ncbi:MAG: GNAT family N-acetyltransferase [Actinomycetota bacterium]
MTLIATERLVLERWSEGDRERFIALYEDPHVYSSLGTGERIARSLIEEEFDWMLDHWERHGFGWRSLIDRASGSWIGVAGLSVLGENPWRCRQET